MSLGVANCDFQILSTFIAGIFLERSAFPHQLGLLGHPVIQLLLQMKNIPVPFRVRTWCNGHLQRSFYLFSLLAWLFYYSYFFFLWVSYGLMVSCIVSVFQSITVIVILMLKLSQIWPIGSSVKLIPLLVFKKNSFKLI